MLSRWFDRSGIGQFLAPDERAAARTPPPDESRAVLWQILAPDPNFAPPEAPPKELFFGGMTGSGDGDGDGPGQDRQVLCQHCHRWTSVYGQLSPMKNSIQSSSSNKATTTTHQQQRQDLSSEQKDSINISSSTTAFFTPTPTKYVYDNNRQLVGSNNSNIEVVSTPDGNQSDEVVNRRVLDAAKDTALSSIAPPSVQQSRDQLFRLCASFDPPNDKQLKRITKLLTKDPTLLRARSSRLGLAVPDGVTVLMAAAYGDNVDAAKIILDVASQSGIEDLHLDRDFQGRNPLHYAAEGGNMSMVDLLTPLYNLDDVPTNIDLLGRTPLGRAIMSPNPKAQRRQRELEGRLFSPSNPSIFGQKRPIEERLHNFGNTLGLAYGLADMPGMRVLMEDATCEESWEQQPSTTGDDNDGQNQSGTYYCLLGVCDGHGDQGLVSNFVATNVGSVLRDCMGNGPTNSDEASSVEYWKAVWYSTCLQLDDKLKQSSIQGGSTAVFALITTDVIVVANVGDSRCILIQKSSSESEGPQSNDPPELQNEQAVTPLTVDSNDTPTQGAGTTIVTALSIDHKPDLPEEVARIENAGLTVVPITFEDKGEEVTIHKVARSGNDLLGTSRSFGDFEYKENFNLGPEDQAVSCIADVQVHPRDVNRDLYLVLACDGVWDVKDNTNVMEFVMKHMEAESTSDPSSSSSPDVALLPKVGDELLNECLNEGSRDNMTTIVVSLQPQHQQSAVSPKALDFGSSPGGSQ